MAIRKDGTPAQNKMDRNFFEQYGDLLEPLDNPEDLPYEARLMYTGDPSEIGSLFVLPSPERRCVGKAFVRDTNGDYVMMTDPETGGITRMLRPCWNWRIRGGKVCLKHGGSVNRVREAAQLRMLAAADAVSGELIRIALDTSQDGKTRVMAINSLLDRTGIKAGVDVNVETKGFEKLLQGWVANGLDDAETAANADA